VLLLVIICLGVTSLAWAGQAADTPAADTSAAVPAAVAKAPVEEPAQETPTVEPAAARDANPETLGVTQNAKGTVFYYDDVRWEVWANIGSMHGLRPKAQVVFVRDGQVVASGTVKTVRDADAIITPAKGTPAGTILKGDDVRVVVNGTRKDMERQAKQGRTLDFLLGVLGWAVMLLHG
jgi:hypothetical protein